MRRDRGRIVAAALLSATAMTVLSGAGCSHDWEAFDPRLAASAASASASGGGGEPTTGPGPGAGGNGAGPGAGGGGAGAGGTGVVEDCATPADDDGNGKANDHCAIWSERFGDALNQDGVALAIDPAGDILVAGRMNGSADFGGGTLTSAGKNHIFVAKFSYGLSIPFTDKKIFEYATPQRGDVIVFKYPLDHNTDYIKRVVGLPGDRLELRQNELFINDRPMPREHAGVYRYSDGHEDRECDLWMETLDEKRHQEIQELGRMPASFGPIVVPEGNVFVMGDNRDNSSDSRVWGPVKHDLIKGKALIVWWSRGSADDTPWYSAPVAWLKSIRVNRFFSVVK